MENGGGAEDNVNKFTRHWSLNRGKVLMTHADENETYTCSSPAAKSNEGIPICPK